MFMYIYKITNLINGKLYIGKHTCKDIENLYFGSGVAIKRAIKKYGKEIFNITPQKSPLLKRWVVHKGDFVFLRKRKRP